MGNIKRHDLVRKKLAAALPHDAAHQPTPTARSSQNSPAQFG